MTEVHYCANCEHCRANGLTGVWLCYSPVLHSPDYVRGGVVAQDCKHLRGEPTCRGYVKRAPRPVSVTVVHKPWWRLR